VRCAGGGAAVEAVREAGGLVQALLGGGRGHAAGGGARAPPARPPSAASCATRACTASWGTPWTCCCPPPRPAAAAAGPRARGGPRAAAAALRARPRAAPGGDAVRGPGRGAGRGARGGPRLRAFAKFVDVERPASASTQHVVAFAATVLDPEAAAAAAASEGSEAPHPAAAGLRALVHGSVNVTRGPDGSLHVRGVMRQLLHLRYQNAGCREGRGGGGTRDGTFPWEAPQGGGWLLLAQQQQQQQGLHQADPLLPARPYVSGCCATAHLQQPTIHLRCSTTARGPFL